MSQTFVPLRPPPGTLNDSIEVDTRDLEIPPDYEDYSPLLAGIVLDISAQHHSDSRRYLDIIKAQLVEAITPLGETDDRVYIFHPNNHDIPGYQGRSIVLLMDYHVPPMFSDIQAVNFTLSLIGQEPHGPRKQLVYITDRNRGHNRVGLEIALNQNRIKDYRCQLHFIGIGDKYNPALLDLPLTAHHLDDPYGLAEKMTEVFSAA